MWVKVSALFAILLLCGCGGLQSPQAPANSQQTRSQDVVFITDGTATLREFAVDLSNGGITRVGQVTVNITTPIFPVAIDERDRFVWIGQEDVAFKDVFVAGPPLITAVRTAGNNRGLTIASETSYSPKINSLIFTHDGETAFERCDFRSFSIDAADGTLQQRQPVTMPDTGCLQWRQPSRDTFYGFTGDLSAFFQKGNYFAFAAQGNSLIRQPQVSLAADYWPKQGSFTSDGDLLIWGFDSNFHLISVASDGSLSEAATLSPLLTEVGGFVPNPRLPVAYSLSFLQPGLEVIAIGRDSLSSKLLFPIPELAGIIHLSSNGRFLWLQGGFSTFIVVLDEKTGLPVQLIQEPLINAFGS